MNEKMKYLKKVFHEVNDYPMSIITKIAQQELMIDKIKKEGKILMKLPIKFS